MTDSMNLFAIFLTGLTTGGVTCAAMQAGLLISAIAAPKLASRHWLPVTAFLTAKLIAHLLLGAALGLLGSAVELSLNTRLFIQAFTALYLLAAAANLLNLHPVFRYVVITPPRFIYKFIKKTSRSEAIFAPALLGLYTVLIPCGVTQAMAVLAVNSASPVQGALILGSFVLGTMPLFTLIGLLTAKLTQFWQDRFLRTAAAVLVLMAMYYGNGLLEVLNAPFSASRLLALYQTVQSYENGQHNSADTVTVQNGVQPVTITVKSNGYSPTYIKVKQNIPVELTVTTQEVYSCATAFTLKAFNIFKQLEPTDRATFTFTPDKPGRYTYACSMGMYTGILEVL